jgi:hypothetical protein
MFRVRDRILPAHIPIGSVSGFPVAGNRGNKLITPEGPLFTAFIYSIYMLTWG